MSGPRNANLSPGIQPEILYPLPDAQRVSRMGKQGFKLMRSEGLQVHYKGRRAYVLGADLISHIVETSKAAR